MRRWLEREWPWLVVWVLLAAGCSALAIIVIGAVRAPYVQQPDDSAAAVPLVERSEERGIGGFRCDRCEQRLALQYVCWDTENWPDKQFCHDCLTALEDSLVRIGKGTPEDTMAARLLREYWEREHCVRCGCKFPKWGARFTGMDQGQWHWYCPECWTARTDSLNAVLPGGYKADGLKDSVPPDSLYRLSLKDALCWRSSKDSSWTRDYWLLITVMDARSFMAIRLIEGGDTTDLMPKHYPAIFEIQMRPGTPATADISWNDGASVALVQFRK